MNDEQDQRERKEVEEFTLFDLEINFYELWISLQIVTFTLLIKIIDTLLVSGWHLYAWSTRTLDDVVNAYTTHSSSSFQTH